MFEGTELATATPDVAKENYVSVNASHEQTTITFGVPQSTPVASPDEIGSPKNFASSLEDMFAFVKRQ